MPLTVCWERCTGSLPAGLSAQPAASQCIAPASARSGIVVGSARVKPPGEQSHQAKAGDRAGEEGKDVRDAWCMGSA